MPETMILLQHTPAIIDQKIVELKVVNHGLVSYWDIGLTRPKMQVGVDRQ